MKEKKTFYTELAYCVGVVCSTIGIALMEKADFGVSMVVAPAYLLHLKIGAIFPVFTFGMAEYTFQALLLILLAVAVQRFRLSWLLSFFTAVLVGVILDIVSVPAQYLPVGNAVWRFLWYVLGMQCCAFGISLMFRTYFSPEVYELVVRELKERYGWELTRVKTVYDCSSLVLGILFSFAFFGFGKFEGVKWGTIVCALINGKFIGLWSDFYDKHFVFRDALKLRQKFEK